MDNADVVLEEAQRQLAELRAMYEQSLTAKEIPARLPVLVKNILENCRSALEYVARAMVNAHGRIGARSQYPLAPSAGEFPGSATRALPGVVDVPSLDAVRRHQPFTKDWLAHLRDLTNENKHSHLSPQRRTEEQWVRYTGPAGESIAHNQGVAIGPKGVSFAEGGVLSFGPGGGISFGPQGATPLGGQVRKVTREIYVDWLFDDLGISVLGTLATIHAGVSDAVAELCKAAQLA